MSACAPSSDQLAPADLSDFARLGISPELLAEAHVQRVTNTEARRDWGFTHNDAHMDLSGLVFPYFDPIDGHRTTCRLRRDHPDIIDGKTKNKYIIPCSDPRHLFVPPMAAAKLKRPGVPRVLVESEKAALALLAYSRRNGVDIIPIATGGCWGWHSQRATSMVAINGERIDVPGPLADLSYCNGSKVYVLIDNNKANNSDVQRAESALIAELGKSKRSCTVLVCDLPVVDAMAEVFTRAHSPARSARFDVRDNGVFHLGRDREGRPKPPLWLCGRLEILAQTRDDKSAEWGRLLRWRDNDHVPHLWAMPNELLQRDGAAVRSELARLGLPIAPGRVAHELLLTYLQTWQVDRRARCVDRLGWHGHVYVVPTEAIGENSEQVVFQNAHALEPAFSMSGTSEEWRDNVAALARGNSRMAFALCVAFAGPLIEPAGEESGGFHLRGASSTGKSTALKLAASVWGNPSHYCRLWRATTNGLEGLAALHSDGVLILDELGQVDPREAGEAAYMLANGRGKARAARDGTARQSATWRLFFLSAGEESLSALMAKIGRKATAGQEIRLADFDADAGAGMGALERLNGFASPTVLAAMLKDAASRYHGSVGATWLRWLVAAERSKLATFISDGVRQFVKEHAPTDMTGQVERVARRFGLVAVAGELATHAGLTGWQQGEAEQAAGKCFKAWGESFGVGTANREARVLLAKVKEFFELYGASRFEDLSSSGQQRINSRAGFFRLVEEGRREYLVLPQVFKNEVCKGFEPKAAVKVLRTHGWLIPDSDGNTQKPRLPEMGTTRVYVIGGKMWGHEE